MGVMLESTQQQISSGTQQWRHFCGAVTAERIDVEHSLSTAADLLIDGWGAHLCVIRFEPLAGLAHERNAGPSSAELRALMAEAEQQVAARRATSSYQTDGDTTLISLPLMAGETLLGVLHVGYTDPPIAHDDLELVAQMLAGALNRHTGTLPRPRRSTAAARMLTAQRCLTETLAAAATIEAALPELLRVLCAKLGWDNGQFWSIDPQRQHLTLSASWPTSADQPLGSLAERGWAEQICGGDAPIWINQPGPGDERVHTMCGTRVESADALHGVLVLRSRRRRAPDHELLEMIASFGSQISQFIELKRAEQGIRRHNDAALLTLNTMSEGVIVTDAAGRLEFVNPALASMIGRPIEALLGRSPFEFVLDDDRPILAQALDRRYGDVAHTFEIRLVHADGSMIETVTTGVPRASADEFAGTVALIGDQTARKRTEAETARLTDALRIERDRLLRREVEVRTQIGRDLHDGPVQQVAVAVMTTQYVRRVAQREPERLGEALDDLQEQLQRTTQDLRTVLYELRPLGIAEEGLVSVLRQYVARMRITPRLRIHLEAPTMLRRLAPDHEAAVFIIMQEAVNNVRKHANARDVWLSLRDDASALCAEVRDNGVGFDVQQMQASYIQRGSFGLLNMHERAQLIGGSCTISSQPGQGTTVQLRIPFSSAAKPHDLPAHAHS